MPSADEDEGEYTIVLPTSWENVTLLGKLSPDNGIDTDGDTLTDWQEADTKSGLISIDENGNVLLPTFEECLESQSDRYYIENVLQKFRNEHYNMYSLFRNAKILPITSNPCNVDTDGDGVLDAYDPRKLSVYNNGKTIEYLSKEKVYNSYMLHGKNSLDNVYDLYIRTGMSGNMSFEEFIEFYNNHLGENVYSYSDAVQTENYIVVLQQCLEGLGYLVMGNVNYGAMAGKTQSAVQLFQLNHGLQIAEQSEIHDMKFIEIDEITFLTILNDAINNGYRSDEKLSNEEIYHKTCSELKLSNVKEYYVNIPLTEPVLSNAYKEQNVSIDLRILSEGNNVYRYDYSKPIDIILNQLCDYGRQWYENSCHNPAALNKEFVSLVNHGEEWDVKVKDSWEKTIPNISYHSQKFTFVFNGDVMDSESLGNFIYGCTGNAFGYSLPKLKIGSKLAGVTGGISDKADDIKWIEKGYSYYSVVKARNGW